MLGILCGIVGTLQATEAIKIILGKGDSLVGPLVTYDSLKMKFREFKLRKDKNCPVCGESPDHQELHRLRRLLRGVRRGLGYGQVQTPWPTVGLTDVSQVPPRSVLSEQSATVSHSCEQKPRSPA